MNPQLLLTARRQKAAIRSRSMAEADRRQQIAYKRIPELPALDRRIAQIVSDVVMAALGGGGNADELRSESLALQERRAQLLAAHGFAPDWLDSTWTCPECMDTGYIEGRPCRCLLQLYDEARADALSELVTLGDESFDSFDLSLYSAQPAAAGSKSPREQMKFILNFCRAYADSFRPGAKNLLLQGSTGLGKTFLSACIARTVSARGYSVVYDTVVSALGAFEDQKFRASLDPEQTQERIDRLLGCDLLILDDLGTEMVTEFTRSALYTLINTRLMKNRACIISTNLTDADLARVYTPQIVSRLLGDYQNLPFVGEDIRRIRKNRNL